MCWCQYTEAACRYLVSEQGWGRHGMAEVGERRQAQGEAHSRESVMRDQADLPQLLESRKTVLGAGLGECSSAFSTAGDRGAVSAAPVTCTSLRVCSSFSESPNTLIAPNSGRGSGVCLKMSSLCCCALPHMPSGCFLLLEFDPTLWKSAAAS